MILFKARASGICTCLLLMVGAIGCYDAPRQSADRLFTDGKLPPILEEVANPKPDSASLRNVPKPALRVGVIDEGVDYLHPQLKSRIAFTWEGDQIVGAGYDVLGKDNWAHPTLIDASIMGFGAELTSDHYKISHSLADPLKTLGELNAKFMQKLESKIHADSKLQDTSFNEKINSHAFHILGLITLVDPAAEKELRQMYEDHKKHKALVKRSHILPGLSSYFRALSMSEAEANLQKSKSRSKDSDQNDDVAKKTETAVKETVEVIQETIDQRWYAGSGGKGFPFPAGILTFYDGFDEFLSVMLQTYHEFDTEVSFETKYLKPYADFISADRGIVESNEKDPYKHLLSQKDVLFESSLSTESNYASADTLEIHRSELCGMIKQLSKSTINSSQDPKAKTELIHKTLADATAGLLDLLSYASDNNQGDLMTKVTSKRAIKSITNYTRLSDQFLNYRDLTQFDCVNPEKIFSDQSTPLYREFTARYETPYTDTNETHSHGTHVSGIIVSQHPKIGIVPIRVMNESPRTSEDEDKIAMNNLIQDLESWLKDPVILTAAKSTLKEFMTEDGSQTPEATRKAIYKIIEEQMPILYADKQSPVRPDEVFFRHVRQAVRYAGENKLKVVNISMGAEVSRPLTPEVKDADEDVLSLLSYLVFEYFKIAVAHDIHTYAPNTLFVIAAGNSKTPIDGETNSALPCDLSSPLLARTAKALGAPAPENNTIDNILCVGSINREGMISSFSNQLSGPHTPFVLSFGEAIPSSIATGDCTGVQQSVKEINGKPPGDQLPALGKDDYELKKNYLIARGKLKTDATDQEEAVAMSDLSENTTYALNLIKTLSKAAQRHQCVTGKDPHYVAKYSGTSMATPAVSGFVGRYLIDKMSRDGLTEDQIYTSPSYAPRKIINEIFASAEKFGGDGSLKDTPMLRNIYDFSNDPRSIPAGNTLSQLQGTDYSVPRFIMMMGN